MGLRLMRGKKMLHVWRKMTKSGLMKIVVMLGMVLSFGGDPPSLAQAVKPDLLSAIKSGDVQKVGQLLSSRVSVNARGEGGITPLIAAAQTGNMDVISLLVDRNADINAQNDKGFTALMMAARGGHASAVKLLLAKGADRTIKNDTGFTAEEIANAFSHAEVINIFSPGSAQVTTAQEQSAVPSTGSVTVVEVGVVDRKRKCMPIMSSPNAKSSQVACARLGEQVTITENWSEDTWVMIVKPVEGWVIGANLKHIETASKERDPNQTSASQSEQTARQRPQTYQQPSYEERPQYIEQTDSSENEHRLPPPQGGSSWWRR